MNSYKSVFKKEKDNKISKGIKNDQRYGNVKL